MEGKDSQQPGRWFPLGGRVGRLGKKAKEVSPASVMFHFLFASTGMFYFFKTKQIFFGDVVSLPRRCMDICCCIFDTLLYV